MQMKYKVSIVLVVFNKWNFTKSCLDDLIKLSDDNEIIVIDNASSDETQTEINKYTRIKYHRNDSNLFHSKACNQGYSLSSADVVLFINNDIRVKSNFNNWTDSFIDSDCLLGPTMGQLDSDLNFIRESNELLIGDNTYLSGWCIGGNKKIWNRLKKNEQVWNEKFPFYFNDTDLSFRCRQSGINLKVIDIPVVHFGKVSAKQLNVHQLYTEARKKFIQQWKK
jgi:GT2 family glycosyltransferase